MTGDDGIRRRIVVVLAVTVLVLGICDLSMPVLNLSRMGWSALNASSSLERTMSGSPSFGDRAVNVLCFLYPILEIIGATALLVRRRWWNWARSLLLAGTASGMLVLAITMLPALIGSSDSLGPDLSMRLVSLDQFLHLSAVPVLVILAMLMLDMRGGCDQRRGFAIDRAVG